MGGAETSKFGPIPQFGDFRSKKVGVTHLYMLVSTINLVTRVHIPLGQHRETSSLSSLVILIP